MNRAVRFTGRLFAARRQLGGEPTDFWVHTHARSHSGNFCIGLGISVRAAFCAIHALPLECEHTLNARFQS